MDTQTAQAGNVFRVPAGAGDSYDVIGEVITFKVTQADTNGVATVMEMLAQPGGGPPLHTHLSAETFLILDGELDFSRLVDGSLEIIRATPGDTVHVPGGVPHTYTAVGDRPARTAVFLTPGGDMERFFKEAGTQVVDGQPRPAAAPDIPALIAIAEKHGQTFLPPVAP
jgi:quercetin dioxygenase-like cupin family protein